MTIKLIFLGSFETEFKGSKYTIYQFLHPTSMSVLSGTNLELKKPLVLDTDYICEIALRSGKIKVVGIQQ